MTQLNLTPQPDFQSLEFQDGFRVPAPLTASHRDMLWRASLAPSLAASQSALVEQTARPLVQSVGRDDARACAKAVLRDLTADKLLLPATTGMFSTDQAGITVRGQGYTDANLYWNAQTTSMTLSGLGLQVAAESARRLLNESGIRKTTVKRAEGVFKVCMGWLILRAPDMKPPLPL